MRSTSHARVGARLPLALAVVWLLLAAHLVAAPGAAASGSVERVEDGGFELGSGAWTFEDGAERCSVASNNCGLPSAAGAFYAATAEFVNAPPGQVVPLRTGIITQLVSVPETSAALSFRVRRTGPGGTYSQLVVRYDGVELVKARPTTPFPLVTVPIPAGLIGPDPRPLTFEAVCVNHSAAHGVCDRFDLDTVSLTSPTAPSNAFTLGKPTLNKRKGLAKLPAKVPGAGTLVLKGKGIKKVVKRPGGAGTVRLPVRAAGKAQRTLERTGKVRIVAKVTFTPTGGVPNTQRKRITLTLRR